jgi:hypothetical protein
MNKEEIIEALNMVESRNQPCFRIDGYVSSNGSVTNYLLFRHKEDKAYIASMEARLSKSVAPVSLYGAAMIDSYVHASNIVVLPDEMDQYNLSYEDIIGARGDLYEATKKYVSSLFHPEDRDDPVPTKRDSYVYVPDGCYFLDPESDAVILMNRRASEIVYVSPPHKVSASGLTSAKACVRAKALVKRKSPIGAFVPQLNLRPGCVTSIRCVHE